MPIVKTENWEKYEKENQDPYSKACVDVARKVMELIDQQPDVPLSEKYECQMSVHKLICRAPREINAGGLTGFMAGCVSQMVVECHSRGQEFKQAWNRMHGKKNAVHVINPALVEIEIKEKEAK